MDIEKKVFETIKKYRLLSKKDKIAVALSGGKDSFTVLYLLKKFKYDIFGLMVDLGVNSWSETNLKNTEKFCKDLGVELVVVNLKKETGKDMNFLKKVAEKKQLSMCAVCGVVRKWILNKKAKELGADKIVTGHNLDDECENILMNFLKGNILLGINSGVKSWKFEGKDEGFVQRIKPLFFIPEREIEKFSKRKKFQVLYKKCPYASETYRIVVRNWMKVLSDREKLRIVENFQKLIPRLQKNRPEIKRCRICGEPASQEVCQACKILFG